MASGGYTYAQMKSMVNLAVARLAGDDRRFVLDLVPYFVNDAYHEIDRRLRWTRCTYDIATVDGTYEYIVPSSVREYLQVSFTDADGNITRLEPMSLDEWIDDRGTTDFEGTPEHYIQHGDRIYLYPTPDTSAQTVTIYVVGEPPSLSADDDKPGFPVHLHQLCIRQAVARCMRHLGMQQDARTEEAFVDLKIDEESRSAAMKRGGSGRVMHHGA